MNRSNFTLIVALMTAVVTPQARSLGKEARPPRWSRDVLDTFFDDARQALDGPRPDYDKDVTFDQPAGVSADKNGDQNGNFAWSKLINAETLEAEVKRMNAAVATAVSKAGPFKSGGYKEARRGFSELAVLFAVTAQYDGNTRWKDVAPAIRDELADAAAGTRVGTDESLRQAAAASAILSDLVRGDRPPNSAATAEVSDWSQVASRAPLMQRLEIGHQERLTKWLADLATFRRRQSDVAHEAQIIAMLAEVIQHEAYEFSDDDTYVGYAKDLEQAAVDLSAAAASGNYEQAQSAIGRATKVCADCHDGYRG